MKKPKQKACDTVRRQKDGQGGPGGRTGHRERVHSIWMTWVWGADPQALWPEQLLFRAGQVGRAWPGLGRKRSRKCHLRVATGAPEWLQAQAGAGAGAAGSPLHFWGLGVDSLCPPPLSGSQRRGSAHQPPRQAVRGSEQGGGTGRGPRDNQGTRTYL
jgi:hypothetical protein